MVNVIETTPLRLVLQSASTTLTLDKEAANACLQRKMLLWALKPVERPIAEIVNVSVATSLDRASGVEICHTMVGMRGGEAWALPTANKQDAEATAAAIRAFLGIGR
jgi:hypothetical protein